MHQDRKITLVAAAAMFSALAFAAVLLGQFIPKVAGFLSYDPKDAVVVIAGFALGPLSAAAVSLVVSLIEMFTVSSTGLYGLLMNVVSTCSFAVPAALIYRKNRSRRGALLGLVCGILSQAMMMVLWNWIITPFYMGVPRSVVEGMLLPTFLPFNLLKGGMNGALAMLLYKPVVSAVRRLKLMPPSESGAHRFHWCYTLIAVALLAAFVVLFLFLAGIIAF